MFDVLKAINTRPRPFEVQTAAQLWTDAHTSRQMLACHLNPDLDLASRTHAFIRRSVAWMNERFGFGGGTRIADFGCGPGLYSSAMAEAGARVTGIDFSDRSIACARETARCRGLDIDYRCADYLTFETKERFDLICLIACDLCAQPRSATAHVGAIRHPATAGRPTVVRRLLHRGLRCAQGTRHL